MIKFYKKGGSKILSVYWFVILLIVAGGIVAMVYSFYNHPYDVRELEGDVMANLIADCMSRQGRLNPKLLGSEGFSQSFKNNFLNECHINFNVEESFENEPQYYFEVNFYNSEDLNKSIFNIPKGNSNLLASCNIQEEKEYQREIKCVKDDFFSFDSSGNLYLIKILVAVKKTEKNVK